MKPRPDAARCGFTAEVDRSDVPFKGELQGAPIRNGAVVSGLPAPRSLAENLSQLLEAVRPAVPVQGQSLIRREHALREGDLRGVTTG
jgi:hypothetical protein